MLNKKYVFSAVCSMCLIMSNAMAAPTVKRLGANSASSGTTTATPARAADSISASRAPSIRSNVIGGKPVTITKVNSENKSSDVINTSRLTVGKYLHNKGISSGVIKPTGSSVVSQSDEILDLTDRVIQLENRIATKQEELSAGEGIAIQNNVISVIQSVQELPEKVDEITEQLDEKVDIDNLSSNYYTKSEVNKVINEQVVQASDTVYDAETGERTYVTIVDSFDKKILNLNQ